MAKYFEITDTLLSITDRYPETIPVFVSNGFPQMEDENQRKTFGNMVTFEVALQLKQKNVDTFLDLLTDHIEATRNGADATLSGGVEGDENSLNIVGLLPCPVRIPMLEQFNSFAAKYKEEKGITFSADLKAASVGVEWVSENVDGITEASQLPDLFISAGFDLFFDKKKIGKFRDEGVFTDLVEKRPVNKLFEKANIVDPTGNYSVISIVPAVFLVNTKELGDRPVPQSWEDLLFGDFEQAVSLPVGDFDLFNAILLSIHDRYGNEGIERLGKVMLENLHPSQMVKSDKKKINRPTVTIMPYFFTKTVKEGGPMVAIWPKDGAIVSPIFMLAKKERAQELKPVVDFFASKEVGETLAHSGLFPSLHPEVDNNLADDTPLMWLGWEKILSKDLTEEIKACNELFEKSVEERA